jgi:hypothetical protein
MEPYPQPPEGSLNLDDVGQLIIERFSCSRGMALSIVRKAHDSGEVQVEAWDPWGISNPLLFPEFEKHRLLFVRFHRDDFICWLNRYTAPGLKRARRAQGKRQSKQASPQRVAEAWRKFRESGLPVTMADFVQFGRKTFNITDQKVLREKYRETTGNPRPGRPRKIGEK